MIHHKIENSNNKNEHYAVSYSTPYVYSLDGVEKKKYNGGILLQVADNDQVRICLSVEEAQHVIELLQENIKLYKESLKKS